MTIREVPCQGVCRVSGATAGEGCRQGNREIKEGLDSDETEEFPGLELWRGQAVGLFLCLDSKCSDRRTVSIVTYPCRYEPL